MTQEIWLAPSILAADFAHLGDSVKAVLDAGAHVIHFDVMDNHYVPNLTLGPMVCQSLREAGIDAPIDVHLMASPVDDLIDSFAKSGATMISIHSDATDDICGSLDRIRSLGCQAGLALRPNVPIARVQPYLDYLDFVLIMTVEPGFGGQTLLPQSVGRIREAAALLAQQPHIRLAVDGGVTLENVSDLIQSGANWVVVGSSLFGHPSPELRCQAFLKAMTS